MGIGGAQGQPLLGVGRWFRNDDTLPLPLVGNYTSTTKTNDVGAYDHTTAEGNSGGADQTIVLRGSAGIVADEIRVAHGFKDSSTRKLYRYSGGAWVEVTLTPGLSSTHFGSFSYDDISDSFTGVGTTVWALVVTDSDASPQSQAADVRLFLAAVEQSI